MEQKITINIAGYEAVKKKVKRSGSSGAIYLPKEWEGKHVIIIRVDELDND